MQETYLSHPTFGLLYSLCWLGDRQAIFTTLYAQRLFFRVTLGVEDPAGPIGQGDFAFEPISRNEARQLLEERIRILRRSGQTDTLAPLQAVYKRTFT